ncbi:MAG TPA: aminoacyl-tRNA hydrolase, partial [Kiritimatiellia bacterium]|nr:aminoacyl-tRNA hydrolase [Kiritimatiellia bacterium]
MWLVMGLGNPGRNYEHTRHNAGWLVLDEFARRRNVVFRRSWRRPVQTAKAALEGAGSLLLVKPTTYMNLS